MVYTKHVWDRGELITSDKLNNIEEGIAESAQTGGNQSYEQAIDLNIDDVSLNQYNGTNVMMLSGRDITAYNEWFDVNDSMVLSASSVMSFVDKTPASENVDGWGRFAIQFYKDTTFISSAYSPKVVDGDTEKLITLENITVPTGANTARFRYYNVGVSLFSVSQPLIIRGTSIVDYGGDVNNYVTNAYFNGGDGWYSNAQMNLPLPTNSSFSRVNKYTAYYNVATMQDLVGSLPAGVIESDMIGSTLVIISGDDNGFGGVKEFLNTTNGSYLRVYSYGWGHWHKNTSLPLGGFNKAGVWYTHFGNTLTGGATVYDFDSNSFYALATDGSTVKNKAGLNTLNIGTGHKSLSLTLDNNGKIVPNLLNQTLTSTFITNTNNELSKLSNPSTQLIVTDTHGASVNNVAKTFNGYLMGVQYLKPKQSYSSSILKPADLFVTEKDMKDGSQNYYISVARLWVKDSLKLINDLSSKITGNLIKSNLGDVEDGRNSSAVEEKQAYDESASLMKGDDWHVIDGNHDEQPNTFTYERLPVLNKNDNSEVNQVINNFLRTRRIDVNRWKESYNENSSYFSIKDKGVVYIYLDTFEGGKLKLKDGTSPNYGEYKKGGKLTKSQLEWLYQTLSSVSDVETVVINAHHLPNSDVLGTKPVGDGDDWWRGNVNGDVLAKMLIAFQNSNSVDLESSFVDMDDYDMTPYNIEFTADFTGKTKNRIAVLNYGHHHAVGHVTKAQNGNFNIVQHPNLLGSDWGNIGSTYSSQFSIEAIDTSNRKVLVSRYSPLDTSDKLFTMTY